MRLLDLHLDRYGPFTDRRLVFDPARPLIVIHGPNEAGKSSALAALTDALYGIPRESRFGFIHDYGAMRIGATLEARDGRRLAFRRRKGNAATLLDADERPLPDDALLPFLGAVDRATFREAFGLDQEGLRDGARRLCAGEGTLGEALLAAAPGLGRLVGLRRDLVKEAERLFTERRSASKPFYAALDRHQAARRRVAELSLGAGDIAKAESRLATADVRLTTLEAERRTLRTEAERLARLARALPRLATLDRLDAEIAALPDRPGVDATFAADMAAIREDLARTEAEIATLSAERDRDHAGLSGLAPDPAILSAGHLIDRLAADRNRRMDADRERSEADGDARNAEAALDRIARDLGIAREALGVARQTPAALARTRSALATLKETADRRRNARDRLAELDARLARLMAARTDAPTVGDPRELRALLDQAAGLPALMDRKAAAGTALAKAERRLGDALAADGEIDDPAGLPARRWPDRAAVEAIGRRLADASRAVEDAAMRAREAAAEVAAREKDIAGQSGPGPATAAALAEARRTRDDAFSAIRAVLFGEREAGPGDRLSIVHAFEARQMAADALADRRAADARQTGRAEAETDALDRLVRRAAEREADRVEAEAAREAVEAEWQRTRRDAAFAADTPSALLRRIERHDAHLDLLAARDAARDEAEAAARASAAAEGVLADLARRIGLHDEDGPDAPGRPDGTLSRFIRARSAVEAIESAWTAARDRERTIADLSADRAALLGELAGLEATAARAAEELADSAAALGLTGRPSPAEIEAALGVLADLARTEDALRAARDRLDRAARFAADFDAEAARLAQALAGGATDRTDARTVRDGFEVSHSAAARHRSGEVVVDNPKPVDRVARLAERLAAERRTNHLAAELSARIESLDGRIATLLARKAEAESRRTARLASAGLPPEADPATAAETARRRRELLHRREEEARALAAEAGEEAALREEVSGLDRDGLAVRLEEIAGRIESLDGSVNAAVAERTEAARAAEAIKALDGAETAAQEEQNALADLIGIAEDWRVRQAAARLAGLVVETYRKRHQSPVLSEAGRLFARLTTDRYAGLASDYDEEGVARLVALAADGRRLAPDALSEGTKDQLYLALRLATLMEHAARAEPLPFIGDDLVITFDEARTAAALEALADFGASVQAILFTHHHHVAAIAEERLKDRAAVLRL